LGGYIFFIALGVAFALFAANASGIFKLSCLFISCLAWLWTVYFLYRTFKSHFARSETTDLPRLIVMVRSCREVFLGRQLGIIFEVDPDQARGQVDAILRDAGLVLSDDGIRLKGYQLSKNGAAKMVAEVRLTFHAAERLRRTPGIDTITIDDLVFRRNLLADFLQEYIAEDFDLEVAKIESGKCTPRGDVIALVRGRSVKHVPTAAGAVG
jgi:hypothetical protein